MYLEKQNLPQSQLYVEYVKGLYKVLERVRAKYPKVPIMLCSGGGGRIDYGALQYFTEFWASDNTAPVDRVFMHWEYSHFYPTIATCAHVTNWDKKAGIKSALKLRVIVNCYSIVMNLFSLFCRLLSQFIFC